MLRLIELLPKEKRGEVYIEKLIEHLKTEGYYVDAKVVEDKLKWYKGEKVAMAVMDKEE
jgi:hypothetical protein